MQNDIEMKTIRGNRPDIKLDTVYYYYTSRSLAGHQVLDELTLEAYNHYLENGPIKGAFDFVLDDYSARDTIVKMPPDELASVALALVERLNQEGWPLKHGTLAFSWCGFFQILLQFIFTREISFQVDDYEYLLGLSTKSRPTNFSHYPPITAYWGKMASVPIHGLLKSLSRFLMENDLPQTIQASLEAVIFAINEQDPQNPELKRFCKLIESFLDGSFKAKMPERDEINNTYDSMFLVDLKQIDPIYWNNGISGYLASGCAFLKDVAEEFRTTYSDMRCMQTFFSIDKDECKIESIIKILKASPIDWLNILKAYYFRLVQITQWYNNASIGEKAEWDNHIVYRKWYSLFNSELDCLIESLEKKKLPYDSEYYELYLKSIITHDKQIELRLLKKIVAFYQNNNMSDVVREALLSILEPLKNVVLNKSQINIKKILEEILNCKSLPIELGSAWSENVMRDLSIIKNKGASNWVALLDHCLSTKTGSPSQKWLKQTDEILQKIGESDFVTRIIQWLNWATMAHQKQYLTTVSQEAFEIIESIDVADFKGQIRKMNLEDKNLTPGKTLIIRASSGCSTARDNQEYKSRMIEIIQYDISVDYGFSECNGDILKGLIWCCSRFKNSDLATTLRNLAIDAYKKIPGIGPRAVKIGNACIYALGAMNDDISLRQLAILNTKVRFRTALKLIDKALNEAAAQQGITRAELEEMSVPAYGMEQVGLLEESLGDFTAQLKITGTNTTELTWLKPDGKTQKSIPAAVKSDFPDELKELKTAAKEMQQMLPAQKARIESIYLTETTWPLSIWRERYLDHPLVGFLARRLIWEFQQDNQWLSAIWLDGKLVDSSGQSLPTLPDTTPVRLWHPIGHEADTIMQWRQCLQDHQIQQPFKQAHREIYILTDAERQTAIYSNRYAAHIVKQHQFNSLCGARGWKNTLKLAVDQDFPPATIMLPQWNLRAEFWTDGVNDENDDSYFETYPYLATDQVRFFPINAPQATGHGWGEGGQVHTVAPIPLESIPARPFSEVMRDIDLFVGVASIGNDPQWQDGGPDGRYRNYWYDISFGALGETAQTRKQVLENLIPRLKIADRCEFRDKFLIVRGDLRTYKIHLGSGNILMEPNDQYLCIVTVKSQTGQDKLFLPFEGDSLLSIIISKALLLADDTRITDPTITQQIKP